MANGGKRALTEWRTSLYGDLLPRRTLFKVYAKAGEEIALGSSGVGVGLGGIAVWTPGHITAPLTVALPAPDFLCSTEPGHRPADHHGHRSWPGRYRPSGGYTPCIFTPATTGVYDVAFYGPAGPKATPTEAPAPSTHRSSTRPRPAASRCGTSRCGPPPTPAPPSADECSPTTSRRSPAATARPTGCNSTLWAVTQRRLPVPDRPARPRSQRVHPVRQHGRLPEPGRGDAAVSRPLCRHQPADEHRGRGRALAAHGPALLRLARPGPAVDHCSDTSRAHRQLITFQGTAGHRGRRAGKRVRHRRQHRVRREHRWRRPRCHRAQPGRAAAARAPTSTPRCPRTDRWSVSWRPASRTSPGTGRTTAVSTCRYRGRGTVARATASAPRSTRVSTTSRCSTPRTASWAGRPLPCSTRRG